MSSYTVIGTWQGDRASVTTEPFELDSQTWALVWSMLGSPIRLRVTSYDNPANNLVHSILLHSVTEARQGGQGISYVFTTGKFELQVRAGGPWQVKLVAIDGQIL